MNNSLPRSLIIAVGLTLGGLVASAAETPNQAMVIDITGSATATAPGGSPRPIQKGDQLDAGTTITTGADTVVNIQPFVGTVTTINQNTTVNLERLTVEKDGSGTVTKQHARINLKSGNVVSMLDPTHHDLNDYGVSTAKGVAAARGTDATVTVDSAGIVAISANADSVTFVAADGNTYTITQGNVIVTPPANSTSQPVTLALTSLANNTSPAAQSALIAIQSGVTAMANVLTKNLGGLSAAGSADLAAKVINVANTAIPSQAANNTAAIVAAVSTSAPAGSTAASTASAIQTVLQSAIAAAPTQLTTAAALSQISSAVAASNGGANTGAAAAALQSVTLGAISGAQAAGVSVSSTAITSGVASGAPAATQAIIAAAVTVSSEAGLSANVVNNVQANNPGVNSSVINGGAGSAPVPTPPAAAPVPSPSNQGVTNTFPSQNNNNNQPVSVPTQ